MKDSVVTKHKEPRKNLLLNKLKKCCSKDTYVCIFTVAL